MTLREHVLKPLLAGAASAQSDAPPKQLAPLDHQYLLLQQQMNQTFELLGIAA